MLGPRYKIDAQTGIWIRDGFDGIQYSDGDPEETRIAEAIAAATDLSVISEELRGYCTNWTRSYHLSMTRCNLLRPFAPEFSGAAILEIGAGCGAITRYLGETAAEIVALEGSVRRACIARSRTRDLQNVTVFAEDFAEFETNKTFDFVTLIGALEYSTLFSSAGDPARQVLSRVRKFLKPGGKLIIAIENQPGLKYLAGTPEEHVGQPVYGVEGRYRRDDPKAFGRAELHTRVLGAGFSSVSCHLPFPDYKFPLLVLMEEGAHAPDFDAATLAAQNVRKDPQLPLHVSFSQELGWPQIFSNGTATDLSNSFLMVASVGSAHKDFTQPIALAYHFSTRRKPEFCKQTVFVRDVDGTISVRTEKLFGGPVTDREPEIGFQPVPQRLYVRGPTLLEQFLAIVASEGWTISDVTAFIVSYRDILIECLSSEGIRCGHLATGDFELPGEFIDALPANLVLAPDGSWRYIDREWKAAQKISFRYLVFRFICSLPGTISGMGSPRESKVTTWGEFLYGVMYALDPKKSLSDKEILIDLECKLYSAIYGGDARPGLDDFLLMRLPLRRNLSDVVERLDESQKGQESMREELRELRIKVAGAERDKRLTLQKLEALQLTLRALGQRNIELATILSKALRHPLKPMGELVRFYIFTNLSNFSLIFSKRIIRKLSESAAKRDPRRFLRDPQGDIDPPELKRWVSSESVIKTNRSRPRRNIKRMLRSLLFHGSGKPRGWFRAIVFKRDRTPRAVFHPLVFKKNGGIRRSFEVWGKSLGGRNAPQSPSDHPDAKPEERETLRRLAVLERLDRLEVRKQARVYAPPGKLLTLRDIVTGVTRDGSAGSKQLLLSVTHDDYRNVAGGVQLCAQLEAQAASAREVRYLALYPSQPFPRLGPDATDAGFTVQVVVDGLCHGATALPVLSDALAQLASDGYRTKYVIHSLLGHSPEGLVQLLHASRADHGAFWIHDYSTACSNFNLLRNDIKFCAAPPSDSPGCNICIHGHERLDHLQRMEDFFSALEMDVLAPSEFALDLFRRSTKLRYRSARIIPHARILPTGRATPASDGKLRIAFLGFPANHKGWPIFADLASQGELAAYFEFHHLGKAETGLNNVSFTEVHVTANSPDEMVKAVHRCRIDIALIWPLWPETFSFTCHEAFAGGAFVVTNKASGNIQALVGSNGNGIVLENEAELRRWLMSGEATEVISRRRSKPREISRLEFSEMSFVAMKF